MIAEVLAPLIVSIICQFLRLCVIVHKRKNWIFSDSPKGASASAVVYTMVEMAKAHDLNIYQYLKYILEQRPNRTMTDEQFESLAPWSMEVQASCKNT